MERGIWKEGNKYTMAKVKEWELFSYVAEFLRDKNTMKKIRKQYGLPVENNLFDRFADLLQKNTKRFVFFVFYTMLYKLIVVFFNILLFNWIVCKCFGYFFKSIIRVL